LLEAGPYAVATDLAGTPQQRHLLIGLDGSSRPDRVGGVSKRATLIQRLETPQLRQRHPEALSKTLLDSERRRTKPTSRELLNDTLDRILMPVPHGLEDNANVLNPSVSARNPDLLLRHEQEWLCPLIERYG
jgi:hypothetical protein